MIRADLYKGKPFGKNFVEPARDAQPRKDDPGFVVDHGNVGKKIICKRNVETFLMINHNFPQDTFPTLMASTRWAEDFLRHRTQPFPDLCMDTCTNNNKTRIIEPLELDCTIRMTMDTVHNPYRTFRLRAADRRSNQDR